MKKVVVFFVVFVLLVLAGCSTSEQEVVDSVEGIVGTWNRGGGLETTICRHSDDGTLSCGRSLEQLDRGEGFFEARFWFEDGKYHEQSDSAECSATGVYEIFVQESGNLLFEVIEDECSNRKTGWVGSGGEEGEIEWEPLP